MEIIYYKQILKAIEKNYNLEFDTKHKYYIGNPYKDSKGNHIPTYFYLNGLVYTLKYVSGCFNPFLFRLNKSNFGVVFEKGSTKVQHVFEVNTPKMKLWYIEKFGERFSML